MIEATRVKQTSTTTGTGNLTLAASQTGFRRFIDVMTPGTVAGVTGEDWAPYMIETADGAEWEFGVARIFDDAGQGELARSTAVVFESSNAGALVSFTADTTVRLITPPNISQYDRGVKVALTASQPFTNGGTIDWDAATGDTDSCWSAGDSDTIFIPAWADEIEVSVLAQHNTGAITNRTNYVSVDGFSLLDGSFSREEFGSPVVNFDDQGTVWRGWINCRLRVDRALVDIGDPAGIRIDAYNNDAEALELSTETYCRMRIIR